MVSKTVGSIKLSQEGKEIILDTLVSSFDQLIDGENASDDAELFSSPIESHLIEQDCNGETLEIIYKDIINADSATDSSYQVCVQIQYELNKTPLDLKRDE